MSTIKLKVLSEKMGICFTTARNMANDNKIPNAYKGGNYHEWFVDDYETFLDSFLKEKNNRLTKICEGCGKITKFKSVKTATQVKKKSKFCLSCASKKKFEDEGFRKKNLEHMRQRGLKQTGENNPFYGKTHSNEIKEKIQKSKKENKNYQSYIKSTEYKEKMSKVTSGKNNPMFGKKVYDIWVEKYGKEIADQKQLELNKKRSIRMLGSNNNMFGKPSPHKSGKGMSGKYKDYYFRSLIELYYIITYLEPNNLPIISAERKDLEIPYINYNGSERTYRADFLVGDTLVEIKPPRLKNTPLIEIKELAAINFCKEHNLIYKIEYIEIKDYTKIFELYKKGFIVIDEKKREGFEKYLK